MNERRRLHSVYMWFALLQTLKGFIPLLLLTALKGVNWSELGWYWYAGIIIIAAALLVYGYLEWSKFSYAVEEDRIVIRKGVLFLDEKTIYFGRIHSVNVEQPIIPRLFGVAQLKIETPGGDKKADGILPAMTVEDAEQLRRLLLERRRGKEAVEAAVASASALSAVPHLASDEEPHIRLGVGGLILAAATSLNFGLVAAFMAGLVSFADDIIRLFAPEHFLENLYNQSTSMLPGYLAFIIIGLSALFVAWLLSIILYVLKYSGFAVQKTGTQIAVSYGLLDKRTYVFDPKKVQAVIIQEGLIRQWIGYAQIQLQVISSDKKEQLMLHPCMPKKQLDQVISDFVPQIQIADVNHAAPKRALLYYIRIELVIAIIACAGLIGLFHRDGLWSLLLLPIVVLWRWACYRAAGMRLENGQLTLRGRRLARVTYLVRRPQIVAMKVKRTTGQQRKDLRTLSVHVMGSTLDYGVACLERKDVERVWNWYSRAKI